MKHNNKTSEIIFEATLRLLSNNKSGNELTVRDIASEAEVNIALINYYYQSKDNLLQMAVQHKMSNLINNIYMDSLKESHPCDQLKKLLISTADLGFDNYEINRIAVEGELRNGCINSCNMIIPLLEIIFDDKDKEMSKIHALQLMVPFHNIMLYPITYNNYLNTDFFDYDKRVITISKIVDSFLKGVC
ncbi:MAG: TetR/AcrR family transcriptional regulator [Bacillota bacterium]